MPQYAVMIFERVAPADLPAEIMEGHMNLPARIAEQVRAGVQALPSFDTATFNGERPSGVWLYTSRCRPSFSVTASMPVLELGRSVSVISPQVLPPSREMYIESLVTMTVLSSCGLMRI